MTLNRLVLFIFLLVGTSTIAQKPTVDERLLNQFSQEQIKAMDAPRLAYWTFYLDHSFQIVAIPDQKAEYLVDLPTLNVPSKGFHAFSINLDEYQKEGAQLLFRGEKNMLLIKPMSQLIEEFNTYYQSSK